MKPLHGLYAIGLVLIFFSCRDENKKKVPGINIPVFVVSNYNAVIKEYYVADIQAIKNVEIRNKIPGFIEHIYVDEGKKVSRGQLLFKINDTEYKTELSAALASLKTTMAEARLAELEVERIQSLVQQQVISNVELEMAKAKLAAAQAKVEEVRTIEEKARQKIFYTTIIAPFDGVIDRIPLKIGSLVQEGSLLTTISDLTQIYAYFKISESQYLKYMNKLQKDSSYRIGKVRLVLADGSLYEHEGRIETMEGEFEATTGSIAMRAVFPNPTRLLKHGASGKVEISNTIYNALVIPQKAVIEVQDKNYVYIVNKENKLELRNFIPKMRLQNYYIVESGVKIGDRVVYEGIQNIKEGVTIVPRIVTIDSLVSI